MQINMKGLPCSKLKITIICTKFKKNKIFFVVYYLRRYKLCFNLLLETLNIFDMKPYTKKESKPKTDPSPAKQMSMMGSFFQ